MTVLETLTQLAGGNRPASGLLHNCRFSGLGDEAYGVEAIVARCRRAPFALAPDALVIASASHVAVFDGARAIIADVFDGNIGRLWLLGPEGIADHEPRLAVPFDPDLDQAGADLFLAADDHPELAPDALATAAALGQSIAAALDAPRTRVFVTRAFGSATAGAALFAVFRLGADAAGFAMAAAHWAGDARVIIRDRAGETALRDGGWTPRIAR